MGLASYIVSYGKAVGGEKERGIQGKERTWGKGGARGN
jgi:hypothetical protein